MPPGYPRAQQKTILILTPMFPAPAFPRRGKRERGRFKFLAAGQWPRRYARKSACSRLPLQVLTATQKPEFPAEKRPECFSVWSIKRGVEPDLLLDFDRLPYRR